MDQEGEVWSRGRGYGHMGGAVPIRGVARSQGVCPFPEWEEHALKGEELCPERVGPHLQWDVHSQ